MRNYISLNAVHKYLRPMDNIKEEEEEGGEYLFDPEAGKASGDPFAHLQLEEAPESAASEKDVSKYVEGEEE
tara:strand:- start:31138 stop:31353 length:216 start_codon:yes stop_codon:yes gene_type:complete